MVRKVSIFVAILALACAISTQAQAVTFTAYDGNPSNTQIQYFRDIVAGIGFNDDYVCFRSAQNEYVMVVGRISFDGNVLSSEAPVTLYRLNSDNGYNSYYSYTVEEISSFALSPEDKIVYSNVGNFPQLIDIGDKYEILQVFTLCALCLFSLFVGIFRKR